MKQRIALLTLLVMVFALGCAKAPAEPVNIAALKGPTGMGLAYVMSEQADAYHIELFDAPDVVTGKFINGEIDIAAVPVNLAATLYNKTDGEAVMIAINTLGAFVRCARLQYVEFYGKFYEPGGRAFQPLSYQTRHVRVTDGQTASPR